MRVPRRPPRAVVFLALVLGLAIAPAPAAAQITVIEGDAATVLVGGYVRGLTGIHDLGFDPPPELAQLAGLARESGFHSEVVRVKWIAEGSGWKLEVHDRLQARVASQSQTAQAVGIGVSAVPDRLVDLRSEFVDRDRLRVWHDIDRLSLTLYTDVADVTVGRQAITWGTATIFPVADLWTAFSPFEQDTEEKPGIDAARALFYPADGLEMDAVVAHRGDARDLSAGLRGTWSLPGLDLWAGGGKFWRELMGMAGVTLLFDETRVRGEAVLPYDLDARALQDPRATLGLDWIRGTLTLGGEYHFNGIGREDPADYAEAARDERVRRGETYYLGRHYLGGLVSWSPDEENRLNLALNGLVNLGDGSAAFTPMASYDLGQAARVALGGLLSLGDTPAVTLVPPGLALESEFGSYGQMVFTTLSVYF